MKKIIFFFVITSATNAIAQNIGINETGTAPDGSAILDVKSNDKGLLIPRIALSATNVSTPVSAPATSLMVYNTATAGSGTVAVTPGFYYWDGTKWERIVTGVVSGGGTDDQNLTGATLSGTTLQINIENGSSTSVNLSSLQDGTGTDSQTLSLSGNSLSISGGNSVTLTDNVNDADNVVGNEYNTNLSLSGTTLSVTDGGGNQSVNLSSLQDGTGTDNQTLSVSGNTLTISSGNSVTLPSSGGSSDDDWYRVGSSSAPTSINDNIYTQGKVGIGVTNPSEKLEIGSGNIELSTSYAIGHGLGTSNEYAIYPRKSGIQSLGVYGANSPANTACMTLESDWMIGIVETDNDYLMGYYDLNNWKYVWAGDVGIGTDTPLFGLHVKDAATLNPGILIEADVYADAFLVSKISSTRKFQLIGAYSNWDTRAIYIGGYNVNYTGGYGYDDANKVIVGGGGTNASLPIYATSFVTSSSRNVKKEIEDLQYGLDEVLNIRPVSYTYTFDKSEKKQIGFIAEEVSSIIPESVYSEDGVTLGMDYSKMTAVLINAMKEQQTQIEELKELVSKLQNKK